jgi:hypothetical protein
MTKRGLDIVTLPFKIVIFMLHYVFKLAGNLADAIRSAQL